jgi:quercetin dioxygenase-like cupin family protein
MDIVFSATRTTLPGAKGYFSGEVSISPVADGAIPTTAKSAVVSFAAGARTAWHTHPKGQMLYVLSGLCLAQTWGGSVQTLRTGDSVWFPPGEKHWHGAAPDEGMVHFAVQEAESGATVDWLELLTDDEYRAAAASS